MEILTNSKLIVGCGNPGNIYNLSRHNVGFQFIDYLSKELSLPLNIDKKKSIYAISTKESIDKLILLKPQTFIGLSGESVLYLSAFFKVSVENIAVIYDDIDFDFGKTIRNNVSHNHSAIKNIKNEIKSDAFTTYGIGIGPLPRRTRLEDFYLETFNPTEQKELSKVFSKLTVDIKKFIGKEYI